MFEHPIESPRRRTAEPDPAKVCPPCNGECNQGRQCTAGCLSKFADRWLLNPRGGLLMCAVSAVAVIAAAAAFWLH